MATHAETVQLQQKSKRPSDTAFKQQRLPAWQPFLTARTVLPAFFIIGVLFIPVGVVLLYFSNKVCQEVVEYTNCVNVDAVNTTCAQLLQSNPSAHCICKVPFTLKEDFKGDVYMYYGLTNYYQNHRRYVKSRDDEQLLGHLSSTPSTDCAPFAYTDESVPIAPCGAIANSMFNDTLTLTGSNGEVPLLNTGIAWPSDKKMKFHNPPGNLQQALNGFSKPLSWQKELWELDPDPLKNNNGFENEDFIVWMRTAALPSFRKLYRRLDTSRPNYQTGLRAGPYTLVVDYNYPVIDFEGTKKVYLSTTSLLGGKNPFLGIAFIVVGSICLVLGVILLLIHLKCSKSTTEVINVNPHTPYS